MTPDYNLVLDTCPALFTSRALLKIFRRYTPVLAESGQNTRLGWDYEVRCASAQRQDGGVGSRERGLVVVVDDGDASVEAHWRGLMRRRHGDDGRDVRG